MRFKITDVDDEQFYQIPKSMLISKKYKNIGNDARVLYAILKDRMILSKKNNWADKNGDIYLLFTQEKLCELLDVSVSTISRTMKKLKDFGLVDVLRQGLNKPNKIYLNRLNNQDLSNMTCPDSADMTGQDLHPRHASETDNSETDCSDTDKSIRTRQRKEHFAEFVTMTNDEYSSLIEKLGSEEGAKWCIERLDNYKGASGRNYKSDYRAILNWVIDEYCKKRGRSVDSPNNPQMDIANDAMELIMNGG